MSSYSRKPKIDKFKKFYNACGKTLSFRNHRINYFVGYSFYNELLRNDRDIHNFITRIEQHFHDIGMVWPLEITTDWDKQQLASYWRNRFLLGYCFL